MYFKGREREIRQLEQAQWKDRASLIALYGRRRVGKTALVEKTFAKERLWKFEGLEGVSARKQLTHFFFLLAQYTGESSYLKVPAAATWEDAFLQLSRALGNEPTVVFLDEFQWMAGLRDPVVSVFKWAWDNHFLKKKRCRFILCGSVSSFMVRHVIRSQSLYGRVDLEMHLEPFSVEETWNFFDGQRSRSEVLDIYLVLGGIPQYLQELRPEQSLRQNLEALAFSPQGYFVREYQRLFISHFAKNKAYETILRLLAERGPLASLDIARALRTSSGGTLTILLEDLQLAGFIEKYSPIDKPEQSRLIQYRMEDEFLRFYFRFIEPNKKAIYVRTLKSYEVLDSPAFIQWRGMAFEVLCRKHAQRIAAALGFSGIRYRAGSWFRKQEVPRVQADLIFDRADHVLTVCEMKYVDVLPAAEMIEQMNRTLTVLQNHFKGSVQKILVLGKSVAIPERARRYFNEILTAEQIFFKTS